MAAMGIDVSKIKVKKDTKDAKTKAMALFQKATGAVKVGVKLKGAMQNISAAKPEPQVQEVKVPDEEAKKVTGDTKASPIKNAMSKMI